MSRIATARMDRYRRVKSRLTIAWFLVGYPGRSKRKIWPIPRPRMINSGFLCSKKHTPRCMGATRQSPGDTLPRPSSTLLVRQQLFTPSMRLPSMVETCGLISCPSDLDVYRWVVAPIPQLSASSVCMRTRYLTLERFGT